MSTIIKNKFLIRIIIRNIHLLFNFILDRNRLRFVGVSIDLLCFDSSFESRGVSSLSSHIVFFIDWKSSFEGCKNKLL